MKNNEVVYEDWKKYLLNLFFIFDVKWKKLEILLVMWFGTDLSSVLSAREMAGFLTALLHAWLLLHRKTIRQQRISELHLW